MKKMLAMIILFLGLLPFARANDVSLAWDPVEGATGYYIYYNLATFDGSLPSDDDPNWTVVDAGNAVQTTVTGLIFAKTYYFVAQSYNIDTGDASPFSNEVNAVTIDSPTLTINIIISEKGEKIYENRQSIASPSNAIAIRIPSGSPNH